jgi:hypothetical protein
MEQKANDAICNPSAFQTKYHHFNGQVQVQSTMHFFTAKFSSIFLLPDNPLVWKIERKKNKLLANLSVLVNPLLMSSIA